MRELEVEIAARAEADLDDIGDYIYEQSRSFRIARNYVRRLRAAAARIGWAPEGGQLRPDVALGLRARSFEGNATIFYRVGRDRVMITRILRAGRDVRRAFTP